LAPAGSAEIAYLKILVGQRLLTVVLEIVPGVDGKVLDSARETVVLVPQPFTARTEILPELKVLLNLTTINVSLAPVPGLLMIEEPVGTVHT
jgi:hypothetical protein